MAHTTLIPTADLAASMPSGKFVIVDCRFALDDTEWGRREYIARHIPGAVYAHIDFDLSGPKTGSNGRHPLPDESAVRATLSRLGIDSGVHVVAYDQDTGMYASRLWWMLRWMGHSAVSVLDGGFAKWLAEERPTSAGLEVNSPREFAGSPNAAMLVSAAQVGAMLTDAAWRLVDARAPERFRGEVEPLDRVAGHIPGASNHFYRNNLADTGVFRSPDELRLSLASEIAGVEPDHVVCYCGSGVTACHNLLALEHAGIQRARLYAGSWSEWSSDPNRPVDQPTPRSRSAATAS